MERSDTATLLKRCSRCHYENLSSAKFCLECGAPFTLACAACGAEILADAKFCSQCGRPIVTIPARFTSPDSYTPKHLADKILASKSALEGERKQVTVLFADLKGSMELIADRDPEEARKLLDPVLERMIEAVHWYEGTVNQVMGDGIMALFGAPIGHEDHAVRACHAALRILRRVNLYADEIQRAGGTPVQIRVGLDSGEVVVRTIGSDLHMDYTAVGQTTNLAARMEQMAKPGSVLVTGDTVALAEGHIQIRKLGAVTVQGLETATQVYELIGPGPAQSRLQARAARGLTRFVGRASELQQLAQALERAVVGHGQIVAVVGEAGVGKSRLYWEFTRSHRTHGRLILGSGSVSYGRATPYLPVIDLLKAYFNIQDRDGQREIRERVAGKLLILDRALEPLLTPLLALLDVPVDDETWADLGPPQRRQRTLEAVKRVLLRESQVQPLLLLFEDLHWIDSETRALLDSLIESLPTSRVLLLVNYRPEYEHAWGRKTFYSQLRIDPLPPESAEELLDGLLGEDRTLEPLKQLLIARTEGNPFFLEESVRTLVETGALSGERGGYRLARPLTTIQVPATIQAVLSARIDRLPPEDKALLQMASVVGKDIPFALLEAIAAPAKDELHAALGRLQGAEFVYETSLFPDLEYTFKHALTYEVAYGSLLQDRRRTLHGQIVETIERLYPDRLPEHIERLARHAFRGEIWDRAVGYLRQAGVRAAARSANREAIGYFEQALVALGHLHETQQTQEHAIDLRFDLRNVHFPLGEHERCLEHLRAAEPLAETLNDHRRLGRVLAYLGGHFFLAADHDRALDYGERALAISRALDDLPFRAEANARLAFVYHAKGDYRRAVELTRWNIEALTGDLTRQAWTGPALTALLSRTWLARCLSEQGEFAAAVAHAEEAMRLGESVSNRENLVHACIGSGIAYFHKGDLDRAIPPLERALDLSRAAGIMLFVPWAASYLGVTYALCGRLAEALPLLEEAVEHRNYFLVYASFYVCSLAEGYFLAGRTEEAIPLAEHALKLTRERGERGQEAWSLRLIGDIQAYTHPSDVEQAHDSYKAACDIADTLGMRPLVAHCHLGLGKFYRDTGKQQEAHEHLTTAIAMYHLMDMPFWLQKAEAGLSEPRPKAER